MIGIPNDECTTVHVVAVVPAAKLVRTVQVPTLRWASSDEANTSLLHEKQYYIAACCIRYCS